MKLNSCFFVVTLVLGWSAAQAISLKSFDVDHDGKDESCYEIATADDLYEYGDVIHGTHKTIQKNNKACGYLAQDIVVNKNLLANLNDENFSESSLKEWVPIGKNNSSGYYDGHFDGNGHSVSGLYLTTGENIGFFGVVSGSDTRNMYISNLTIKDSHLYGSNNVGGLIGLVENINPVIENCFVDSSDIRGERYTGGLVGHVSQSVSLSILNSGNSSTVTGNYPPAGGILGYSKKVDELKIVNSYNAAEVDVWNKPSDDVTGTGGLVGLVDESEKFSLFNVYNEGRVYYKGVGASLVGKIASVDVAKVKNAYGRIQTYFKTYKLPLLGDGFEGAVTANLFNMNAEEGDSALCLLSGFENGGIAYLLHSYSDSDVDGSVWGQDITAGEKYPNFSGKLKGVGDKRKINVTFVVDADTPEESVTTMEFVEDAGKPMPVLNRDGYVFGGWCSKKDCSEGAVSSMAGDFSGDRKYYANLLKIETPSKNAAGCYQISTAGELYGFAVLASEDPTLCAELTKNIVVNQSVLDGSKSLRYESYLPWMSIKTFSGTFDGKGFTISGLYYEKDGDNGGFFDKIEGAKILNLGIVDSYFSAAHYVGIFAGSVEQSYNVIRNSFSNGAVYGGSCVGGFVGDLPKDFSERDSVLVISQSYNESFVSAVHGTVGGFIGRSCAPLYVYNCYNLGKVYVTEDASYAGGFLGYYAGDYFLFENCYSLGEVSDALNTSFRIDAFANGYMINLKNVFVKGRTDRELVQVVTDDFVESGMLATMLHNYKNDSLGIDGSIWGQDVSKGEKYPTFSKKVVGADSLVTKKLKFVFQYDGKEIYSEEGSFTLGIRTELPYYPGDDYVFGGWCLDAECSDGHAWQFLQNEMPKDSVLYSRMLKVVMPVKKDGCYQISSAAELYGFAQIVNDQDVYNACAELTDDIVVNKDVMASADSLNDYGFYLWEPIGVITPYGGNFKGNGHTISGIYAITPSSWMGFIMQAKADSVMYIEDLTLEDSYFSGYFNVGAFIAGVDAGKVVIRGCTNKSYVFGVHAAGFVAFTKDSLVIENSVNEGTIESVEDASGFSNIEQGYLSIKKSANLGTIRCKRGTAGLARADHAEVNVSNSYNSGSVYGNEAAGLVFNKIGSTGANDGKTTIKNSHNYGVVAELSAELSKRKDDITLSADSFFVDNVFYRGTSTTDGIKKTEEEFADGSVAKLLRNYVGAIGGAQSGAGAAKCGPGSEDGSKCGSGSAGEAVDGKVWGQVIGTDAYPVFREGLSLAINYHLNGGSLAASVARSRDYGEDVELPTPTRKGYTFAGWYADEAFAGAAVERIESDDGEPKDFYAKWKINTYTVTFYVDSKQYGDAQMVEYGKDATKPKDPVKDGYKFLDWDASIKKVSKNLDVNAKFEKIESSSSSKAGDKVVASSSSGSGKGGASSYSSSSSAKAKSSSSKKAGSASSSSAKAASSSSTKPRSSSSKKAGSSSSKKDAIAAHVAAPMFGVNVAGREIQVTGASVGAECDLFDAQGRLMYASRVGNASFAVAVMQPGRYIMRIGSQTVTLNVK